MNMESGEIYELEDIRGDKEIIKILIFDEVEIFFDAKLRSNNEWSLSTQKTFIFSRIPQLFFKNRSKLLGFDEILSNDKLNYHIDLPLRILRFDDITWGINGKPLNLSNNVVLPNKNVYLEAFGKKGGTQKPVLFNSSNINGFTEVELYEFASSIQNFSIEEISGIGIYRSGSKNGIPTYYLWGYHDMAGITQYGLEK